MLKSLYIVRFAISVVQVLLYQSIDIDSFSLKSDQSFILCMTASNAQSPVPGLDLPCLRLIPCFWALLNVLAIITSFSCVSKLEITLSGEILGLGHKYLLEGGGSRNGSAEEGLLALLFFLLLLGILS